jgi:hypothetical protein
MENPGSRVYPSVAHERVCKEWQGKELGGVTSYDDWDLAQIEKRTPPTLCKEQKSAETIENKVAIFSGMQKSECLAQESHRGVLGCGMKSAEMWEDEKVSGKYVGVLGRIVELEAK